MVKMKIMKISNTLQLVEVGMIMMLMIGDDDYADGDYDW